MSQKLWVSYVTPAKTFGPTKVSIQECSDVDDFLNTLYQRPLLCIPSKNPITLYKSDGNTEIKPTDTIKSLGNLGKDADAPLVVKTTAVGKSSRLVTTRKMSVEASCRKYLDAIAKRLAEFYEFNYRFKSGATIGDVLEAKDGMEGEDWDFRKTKKTHYQTDDDGFIVQICKGQPLKSIKLPDLFTPEEWEKISKFNKNTTQRVHDGQLPHLSNGKPYIVIPRDEFTDEMILFLKSIGVKATLFSSLDDLEVKDEDFLSDNSFVLQ
jgi:hypothetical protein